MSNAAIRHEVTAHRAVHTVTIDHPPGNVIDIELCEKLVAVIDAAAQDDEAKVLVVRGAGRHFSFGASVEEHLPASAPGMLAAVGEVVRRLLSFPYPTLAGVQGRCLGGGFELVLACGIVIAEEDAQLASPEIQLGVFAPAATAMLTGRGAEDLLLTGRSLSAEEGLRMGIVNVVAPKGDLDATVDGFVSEYFVPRSALSLRLATRAIRERSLADKLLRLDEAESLYLDDLLPTHDGVEGIQAFLEKRPPLWTNA